MAEESAVKVCVRVRPLIEREQTVESAEPAAVYWKADKQTIRPLDNGKSYSFDRVFSAEETTNQLYQDIAKPLVVSAVEGYNGTIFAYGQTASGKTFTMMGSNLTPGVIPLAMEDVFQTIKSCPKKEFLLRVSYLEIYNETVTDLLCDSWKRKPLEIHEGINKTVYVGDLVEELVRSPEQALAWIKKGEKNRHYGKTKMNQRSSRSHTIFRMILESRERSDPASGENADGAIFVSHLNLVDLAGSERASQTGAEGARLKEGCNINRSLFVLGQVIKKLSVSDENQRGFINYRDSKVTRILQNSLGGNAKTVIICTITPAAIEETIGTLQFASAAKNMKNDPHVTEVSDDGALLKRYRNEITELKRRLSEVSSVTQTTVTEKESLSQLLQEKDQLQREQEDRIKNLTKLLVTSSDFPVKKVPKRRVTWGGKLLRSSVAETFSHEAKGQKLFTVGEQDEDAEDFDSRWDIPEEPIFDTEMDQSSVTVRSFSESPSRVNELSDKVSCLEQQLETETLQKREAMEKVESSERRIADLEKQLEEKSQMPTDEQEQMRKGFEESIQFCETLVSEKERISSERDYLKQELDIFREQTGNLQNDKTALQQELEERKEMDEFKSLEEESKREYERELQNDISTLKKSMETAQVKCQELEANLEATSEELKKKAEWAEELQSLSDKDLVQQVKQLRRSLDDAEGLSRDTKKEWAFLRSENISLKERDVTLTVGHEKMEAEVNSLHHQLETEKSRFKKMQSDLQRELQGVFDENTKLTTLLDGKVPKNILDSVVLERTVADLKKELETYREGERTLQAQVDDLSELQVLPDKVNSLMKQVCELTEDLCAVQADRDSLVSAKACSDEDAQQLRESFQSSQTQLEKLHTDLSSAELRENNLTQQCSDVTAQLETFRVELERSSVENSQLLNTVEESSLRLKASEEQQASIQAKFDEVQDLMEGLDVKLANSESIRSTEEQFGKELQEQIKQLSEQLECVRAERDHLLSEKTDGPQNHAEELQKLLSNVTSLTEEREQLQEILDGVREERNQLKLDVQENVDMMIENQEELRAALEKNREQQDKIQHLETAQMSQQNNITSEESSSPLEELQNHMRQLSEELECVRTERDRLLSEKTDGPQNHAEELEKLLSNVTCLTEERDQLQEILQGVREEKNQLKRDLEEMEMCVVTRSENSYGHEDIGQLLNSDQHTQISDSDPLLHEQMKAIGEELQCVRAERDRLLSEKTHSPQNHTEELEKLLSNVTSLTEERDQLQGILEGVREEKNQLKRDLEENMETILQIQAELKQQQHVDVELQMHGQQDAELQQQIQQLEGALKTMEQERNQLTIDLQQNMELMKAIGEELQCVRAERDRLLSEKTHSPQNHTEELEKLLSNVTSLTEERDQLQGILEGVREEKNQLKRDLEENMETILQIQAELKQQQHVDVELQMHGQQDAELQQQIQQLEGALKTMEQERNQLTIDLQQNMELTAKTQALVHSVQEEFKQERQLTSDLERRSLDEQSHLEQQLKDVREELECLQAERDHLRSEKTDSPQNHAEEVEKLLSNVTSLTEERKRLQEILEDVREEKNKLQRHIEDNKDTVVQVQAELKRQQQLNSEQQAEGEQQEVQLHQQIQALQRELETMQAERSQLKLDLQEKMEMAAETQGLLCSIQVELRQQRQLSSELVEKESQLEQRAKELSEELEGVGVERDRLQSESVSLKNHAEELQKQLSNVTCLTEERDQLQEILEGVREEKNQLKRDLEEKEGRVVMVQKELRQQQQINSELQAEAAQQEAQLKQQIQQLEGEQGRVREERTQLQRDLQDNMHMVLQVQTSLKEQQHLNSELQAERGQQEAQLKQQLMELEEKLQGYEESHLNVKAEVECSNQLLSEANQTISVLTEQINNLEHATTAVHAPAEGLGLRLEDSTLQLQGSFVSFEQFMGGLSLPKPLEKGLYITGRVEHELLLMLIPHLPKPVRKIFCKVIRYGAEFTNAVQDTMILLRSYVMNYQELFEALVQQDVAVFEDRRLQDVLLCRAQAPRYSVREEDLQRVWDLRLTQLIDHRRQNLLKMSSVLERLEENKATCQAGLSAELREVERCNQGLRVLSEAQPVDLSAVESLLEKELARRSAAAQGRRTVLQGLREEHTGLIQELERVREQADHQLREERSKTFTLLPLLENAPIKTEADLLKDNQQLVLLLDQSQTENKVMQQRVEQLEEDQIKADDRVSSHKQATQLLQTELQDACAQVHEREGAIQTLQEKLRETEAVAKRRASPSAVELEKEKAKVVKMEVEMTSLSTKHQEEILKMTTVLKHKEEALRKLRETLRKSQQEGEDSFMQGEDLHARLTTTRGRTVQSSVLLEKNKLEEEVRQLRKKIAELESLVSGQKVEITKWKGRALTLKHSRKDVVEKPLTPCTPTKRRHPMTLEGELLNSPKKFLNSPKKFLDSPKKFLDSPKKCHDSPKTVHLDSPKVLPKFFDVHPGSETSINCPKQFFDNSYLGTIPEVSDVPIMANVDSECAEEDGVVDKKEEWWPLSPKQADVCKPQ